MKKIAIIYPEFTIGGTTTSIIFLLNSLDYRQVKVDLLVYRNKGELRNKVNSNVNVVEVGLRVSKIGLFFRALLSGKLLSLLGKTIFKKNFYQHFKMGLSQIGGLYRAKKTKTISKTYDLAIGFMEFWADEYLLLVKAKKKNMIIHPNYESAHFNIFLDRMKFEKVDNISFVSASNCDSFNIFTNGMYSSKVMYFPNLINKNTILEMASEPVNLSKSKGQCLLVTSARISSYVKGFDRMIAVANELKMKNFPFLWIIVGAGPDEKKVKVEVKRAGLENNIIFVGKQTNPYKYINLADYFVLLSRREGRPISVDEAIILRKRCVVTEYETANEQLCGQKYGLIVSNNDFSPKETADLICADFLNNKNCEKLCANSELLLKNQKIVEEYMYG